MRPWIGNEAVAVMFNVNFCLLRLTIFPPALSRKVPPPVPEDVVLSDLGGSVCHVSSFVILFIGWQFKSLRIPSEVIQTRTSVQASRNCPQPSCDLSFSFCSGVSSEYPDKVHHRCSSVDFRFSQIVGNSPSCLVHVAVTHDEPLHPVHAQLSTSLHK